MMGGSGEVNRVMSPPQISTEQLIALHGFLAEAVAEGELLLADLSGFETDVDVEEVRATALSDFGERGLVLSDDLIAGVVGRLEGVMPGSLSLVLDPDEALLWSQQGIGDDPIATYVSFGGALLEGVASAFGKLLAGEAGFEVDMSQFSGQEDGYSWSQTDDELEVVVPVPSTTRAKDVSCTVMPRSLAIAVAGSHIVKVPRPQLPARSAQHERRCASQGPLLHPVQNEDCDWTLGAAGPCTHAPPHMTTRTISWQMARATSACCGSRC